MDCTFQVQNNKLKTYLFQIIFEFMFYIIKVLNGMCCKFSKAMNSK